MELVVTTRESERLRLIEEARAINARLLAEEENDRLDELAAAGDRLLEERVAMRSGVTDWSEL